MKKIGTWFKSAFTKDKIVRFLDKQGFYIVLFACIAIIAATAIITSNKNFFPNPKQLSLGSQAEDKSEPASEQTSQPSTQTDSVVDDTKVELKIQDVASKDTSNAATDKKTTAVKSKAPSVISTAKAASSKSTLSTTTMKLIMPVPGQIMNEYAEDHLIYSNTLQQWCTHSGLDIAAATGTEVKAAAAGKIESITNDDRLGIIITIDHGNGIKTRYGNLSTGEMVKEGQTVEAGQTISGVGNTAAFEIADAPHLHFEVIVNGKTADPTKYIK